MRHQDRRRLMRIRITTMVATCAVAIGLIAAPAPAAEPIANLRGSPIVGEPSAPTMPKVVNTDLRRGRNYPEQPPTIPHKTRGYQVDRNSNKCLTCHSRAATEESQAPMISVTHFMDRDGQVRAQVAPRRYFCNQCHVTQVDAKPLIGNTFVDVDKVVKRLKKGG